MRVLFLTHYYPPEAGAPQARISALAAGLREAGVDARVHTGFPHYPAGAVLPPYRNRALRRERDAAGVPVTRSVVLPVANRGFIRRLADHTAFAAGALTAAPLTGPQDVVVVETPPLFLAAAAIGYARSKGARLVVHASDLWPASAVELGALRHPGVIATAERLERAIYRAADAVTVPTRGMVDRLRTRPEARGKVRHMPPTIDLARFPRTALPERDGPLRVLYAGTVGLAQGLETVLAAARHSDVEVTVAGGGARLDSVRRSAPANVLVLGPVAPARVPALYARAHAGLVPLRDRPVLEGALPTKLLEVLAAGRPAVVSAHGEAAALVREAGAGVVCRPGDPAALAAAFTSLRDLDRMGAAGRAWVERHATLDTGVARWLALLGSL